MGQAHSRQENLKSDGHRQHKTYLTFKKYFQLYLYQTFFNVQTYCESMELSNGQALIVCNVPCWGLVQITAGYYLQF